MRVFEETIKDYIQDIEGYDETIANLEVSTKIKQTMDAEFSGELRYRLANQAGAIKSLVFTLNVSDPSVIQFTNYNKKSGEKEIKRYANKHVNFLRVFTKGLTQQFTSKEWAMAPLNSFDHYSNANAIKDLSIVRELTVEEAFNRLGQNVLMLESEIRYFLTNEHTLVVNLIPFEGNAFSDKMYQATMDEIKHCVENSTYVCYETVRDCIVFREVPDYNQHDLVNGYYNSFFFYVRPFEEDI